jgi:hypothetical protein
MASRLTKKGVSSFLLEISKDYDIDMKDLENRLEKNLTLNAPKRKEVSKEEEKPEKESLEKLDPNFIAGLKVAELKALCKSRKLLVSGTKQVLQDRLLGITGKKAAKPVKTRITAKDIKKEKSKNIIQQMEKHQNTFNIRKSVHGNLIYEIEGEYFIFSDYDDPALGTRRVIGVETEDGEKRQLNPQDIEKCQQHGLNYILPDNLGAGDDDASIDELDGEQDGVNEEELLDKNSGSEDSENSSEENE